MSDAIVAVQGMEANGGIISVSIKLETCPHCGEVVPVMPSRWTFSARTGRPFPCPACGDNMHAEHDATSKLTEAGRAFYKVLAEATEPVRFEELANKSGYSESALKKCLPQLEQAGVHSTPAGYTLKAPR